jgi:hypothetical protein
MGKIAWEGNYDLRFIVRLDWICGSIYERNKGFKLIVG